jgi:hypothetical protein
MSFIYDDKNLINELLKIALEHEKKFSKQAQAPAPANLDPAYTQQTNNFTTLLQLIDNLETRIGNPNDAPEISHAGAAGAKATMSTADLVNLGTLVAFVAGNGIIVDGRRIAYIDSPDLTEKPDSSYVPFKLEPGPGAITNPNRGSIQERFLINRNLLAAYIQSLFAELVTNPNQVTSLMLKSIAEQSNKLLGTKIDIQTAMKGSSSTQSKDQPAATTTTTSQENLQANIDALMQTLPFDSDFIDFDRITQFLSRYINLVSLKMNTPQPVGGTTLNLSQISEAAQNAENAFSRATSMTLNGETRISLQSNYGDIENMLKPPHATNYTTFINLLQNGIQATYTVVGNFYSNWVRNKNPSIRINNPQDVEAQILGDNSYYRKNVIVLNEWLSDRGRVK